jgi:hypothetical protein
LWRAATLAADTSGDPEQSDSFRRRARDVVHGMADSLDAEELRARFLAQPAISALV